MGSLKRFLMRYILTIVAFFCFLLVSAQADEEAIIKVMSNQESAWNNGDLKGFMQGYWNNDSLVFIGSKGLTYGWQNTLDNYKKSYPDKAAMGTLLFTIKKLEVTKNKTAFVIGTWSLQREEDNPNGHFTLYWKKLDGQWVIVADHSS